MPEGPRYWGFRAQGRCVECGAPSAATVRCRQCMDRLKANDAGFASGSLEARAEAIRAQKQAARRLSAIAGSAAEREGRTLPTLRWREPDPCLLTQVGFGPPPRCILIGRRVSELRLWRFGVAREGRRGPYIALAEGRQLGVYPTVARAQEAAARWAAARSVE